MRLLVISCIALLGASCAPQSVSVREVRGAALPPDMALPVLQGSAESIAEQLCQWSAQNQIPFTEEVVSRVHVIEIRENHIAHSLLNVFLQREGAPTALALEIDASRGRIQTGSERVYALIEHPGLWLFEKVDTNLCEAGSDPSYVRADYDGIDLCVRVLRLQEAPSRMLSADYRELFYHVPLRRGPPQSVAIGVMTLSSGGVVVGRSVRVELHGAWLPGHISHLCEPAPVVLAFESA